MSQADDCWSVSVPIPQVTLNGHQFRVPEP
jgi:hypothetical protein